MDIFYTNQFQKDLVKLKKQGKDLAKIKVLMEQIIQGTALNARYKDHKLIGNYKNRRECHIEPDWLLIYKKTDEILIFERTGSHSELFK
ncbi:MAG: hypothetical protein K0Q51_702 [Rickettsiaceae bacterium]|jgi:mRNA interferase YafQ|nr:hypothetical protein [Rickettsiaceae bacterium]